MDQNPYESPQPSEPLTPGTIAKRGLGVGTIVLLTPVAVAIAFGGSCLAVNAVVAYPAMRADLGTVAIVGIAVFIVPPVVVLLAMIWWAIRTHHRNKILSRDPREKQ